MCVQGSTNGTNGIPILFMVLPIVPLVIPNVTNGTIRKSLATNGPLVKLSMVLLGEPRTEPISTSWSMVTFNL